jgi:hypothetical protein
MKNVIFATRIPKPAIPKDYGPGPTTLLTGTPTLGYFGALTPAAFITGSALSALAGVAAGEVHSTTTDWLKFSLDGKVVYVPKAPIRRVLTWDQLNAAGVVFGKEVTFGGRRYKVRLMTGGDADPSSVAGGEWNKLMYGVCTGRPAGTLVLANFSNTELNVVTALKGNASICQEKSKTSAEHIQRGFTDIKSYGALAFTGARGNGDNFGWRPLLELIE